MYRADRTHLLGNPSIIHGVLYCRAYVIVQAITKLIVVLLTAAGSASAQAPVAPAAATVKGIVVDARTGTPLPRVLVAIEGGLSAQTGQ